MVPWTSPSCKSCTFMLGILQSCCLCLPTAGLRQRLRFLASFFSIFTKTLGVFFLAQIKRDAGMRVQFSVYIPWKTLTHTLLFPVHLDNHQIGLVSSWGMKTDTEQCVCRTRRRAPSHVSWFIDHSIIVYIEIPRGAVAFWATTEPLTPHPTPCLQAISIIALAARPSFSISLPFSLCLSFFLALSLSTSLSTPFPTNGQQRDEGWRTLKKKKQTTNAFCISKQPTAIPTFFFQFKTTRSRTLFSGSINLNYAFKDDWVKLVG